MEKKKSKFEYIMYLICRWLVKTFYPRKTLEGTESIPEEPAIYVGNHSQTNGPIIAQLYMPFRERTWCIGEMMDRKQVPAYAMKDFWPYKNKVERWFLNIFIHIVAPLCEWIFKNADTIPVYKDSRLITTYRESIKALQDGVSLVIYPEENVKYNNIICNFQDKFIDTARLYYKKTGKELLFVPMYLAPRLNKVYYGKPTRFNSSADINEERARICKYLMDEITHIAVSLPEHTVVPYLDIRKKDYPRNIPYVSYLSNEETSC